MQRLGLVGYGRFGAAFASLVEEANQPWLAYDPNAEIPEGRRADSLEALAAACDGLLLAVPVTAMVPVLETLRPHLDKRHLVMDVGSVKVAPCQWLEDRLGEAVPFIGTHPLFGPVSLSHAERPLRTIICPSPRHPEAADRVEAWMTSLGLEVLRQTPEAHDQVMATTHALTFFLSKGLMDAGCGGDLPFTPPSFHAIARTLEAVRGDAGHLFPVIENLNPFARPARERFMESLAAIHGELEAVAGKEDQPRESLAIPALPAHPELAETRVVIDEVDRMLVHLLARRADLARRVAKAKAKVGAPVLDPAREAALLSSRRAWAEDLGLDPETVASVFKAVMRGSRRVQETLKQGKN